MLTVSAAPSFAAKWLLPRLSRFLSAHPEIEVSLKATMELADFARGDADLGIRYGSGGYTDLESELLMREAVFPVCSPRILRDNLLNEPRDLQHHTLLHLDWTGQAVIWPDWPAWLRVAGVPDIGTPHGIHFTDFALCLQAAVAGQGVALGTTGAVADLLADGRLVSPFEKSIVTPFAYYIVHAPDVLKRPEAQGLLDWILEEARATEV